jgi:DNA-binding NarL/FixJ family response regulator
MPFNANNPYSIVAQVIRDPMVRLLPNTNSGPANRITDDESKRILRLYRSGKSQDEISSALGRSSNAVGMNLRKQGIVTDPRKRTQSQEASHAI